MHVTEKEIASLVRALSRTANKPHFTSAIIAAAGCGSRMGNRDGKTKQMMELDGLPIIVRTLLIFEKSDIINEIIVVAREDELSDYDSFKREYGLTKITAVVAGGSTRQESVLRGFEAIDDRSEFVAIHDGARCLLTDDMLTAVVTEAYRRGAATAAQRATDTVKRVNRKGFIDETIDREEVWLAQTPQVFKTEVYRAAAYVSLDEDFRGTDDNSLCEYIGFEVKAVDCGRTNIKITEPSDLVIAKALISLRETH